MKRLMRCITIVVILMMHAPANASGEEHPNVDQEIKATWASVLDGRYNDAIARATKLLNQVDPIQDGEAYWRASSMWAWCLFDLGARERGTPLRGGSPTRRCC